MHQLYPDSATATIMNLLLNAMTHFNIHLFTNNLTPTLDSVLGDFTEAAWTGYAAAAVSPGSFSVTTSGHLTTAIASPVSFSNTSGSPVDAYGYFVTDDTGALVACARFDTAPVSIADGGSYPVVPIIGDFSQYSS